MKLLYWPALARSGELMVRDFEDSGPPRVHIVADVRPLVGEPGSERVLATVAGLGLQVLAQGSVVELSTTAGERMAIGPGPVGAASLLRAIASIETPRQSVRFRRRDRPRDRRRARDSPAGRAGDGRPTSGTAFVVTTVEGVRALPDSLAFARVVIAP